MEEVEESNKIAVESCHKVLDLLTHPQDQYQIRNVALETDEAVSKFKNVVSLLNSRLGYARVRKSKIIQTILPQNIFLEKPKSLQLFSANCYENSTKGSELNGKSALTSSNPSLALSFQDSKNPVSLMNLQLQMKRQAEALYGHSTSGISLNFDSSKYTPSMSSTRSFISSLSVDGSVANQNSFHLIGPSRRCSVGGEDGSVKCGSNGRCHCSKKRKHRVKKSIKVPAISNKLADIPPDEYSWRKYGQKPIKGSPHPGYPASLLISCRIRGKYFECHFIVELAD